VESAAVVRKSIEKYFPLTYSNGIFYWLRSSEIFWIDPPAEKNSKGPCV
jgi:hypothetical protein